MQKSDLIGQQFGQFIVLAFSHTRERPSKGKIRKDHFWLCQCNCGNQQLVESYNLRSGLRYSCVQCSRERLRQHGMKHGAAIDKGEKGRLWRVWLTMKSRCFLPTSPNYPKYGGRGITVCDRWKNSFEAFLEDMGYPPTPKHSLDRIDNNGNYEPGNCRWATHLEQANNTRTNKTLTVNGVTKTYAEWARELDIPYKTFWYRLKRGYTLFT